MTVNVIQPFNISAPKKSTIQKNNLREAFQAVTSTRGRKMLLQLLKMLSAKSNMLQLHKRK